MLAPEDSIWVTFRKGQSLYACPPLLIVQHSRSSSIIGTAGSADVRDDDRGPRAGALMPNASRAHNAEIGRSAGGVFADMTLSVRS
jgi:hypothetical protein